MSHGASPLAAFNRLGDRSRLPDGQDTSLRPALMAPFHDLARLRGDFPLLVGMRPGEASWLSSLTDCIDTLARETTRPGPADEPARRHLLALEQAIRSRAQAGARGPLAGLLTAACEDLTATGPGAAPDAGLQHSLEAACAALPADAELLDFDAETVHRLLRRAWLEAEQVKCRRLERRTRRLAQRLTDLLRADRARSHAARTAKALRRASGDTAQAVFDFQAMAQVLRSAPAGTPLPAARKQRIQAAIDTLRTQRFAPQEASGLQAYDFEFDDCSTALAAFRRRLPAMRDLVRAMAIAELELENRYDGSRHDSFFDRFSEDRLGPGDLEQFPSYLLRLQDPDLDERARLLALLESGIQVKIVVQYSDIAGDISNIEEQFSLGRWAQNLARMALGLDEAFVLQAPATLLWQLREPVLTGMARTCPALFSVYLGPDYLATAAAAESRAFPCLVYDPQAGSEQAQRYSLDVNPQPERDWPRHRLNFENPDHAPESVESAFTLADFLAADPRFGSCFAAVGEAARPADPDNELLAVADYLALDRTARSFALPYVLVTDAENRLQRAIVDEKVIEAAERCLAAWRSLQQRGGKSALLGREHGSPAPDDGAAATPRAEASRSQAPAQAKDQASALRPAAAGADEPLPAQPATSGTEERRDPDEPWIETIRCTTCNECTQINDRMFAYNEDQRAYIADPDAGTYRELVQAAESCQVAIIHPGRPRNPDEPGLEDLVKRAEPFL